MLCNDDSIICLYNYLIITLCVVCIGNILNVMVYDDTTHKELYTIEGRGFSHEASVITQDTLLLDCELKPSGHTIIL